MDLVGAYYHVKTVRKVLLPFDLDRDRNLWVQLRTYGSNSRYLRSPLQPRIGVSMSRGRDDVPERERNPIPAKELYI